MAKINRKETEQAHKLYEIYGKPLEQEHRGEYVAVSEDGKILAPTLLQAAEDAGATFGPGNFIFKVGERAVGRWRWLKTGL